MYTIIDGPQAGCMFERLGALDCGGRVWSQERAARAKMVPTAVCPYCNSGAIEDHDHLWWHCSTLASIRSCHPNATVGYDASWPACLRICGLMPAGGIQMNGSSVEHVHYVGNDANQPASFAQEWDDCISVSSSDSQLFDGSDLRRAQAQGIGWDTRDGCISVSSSDGGPEPAAPPTTTNDFWELLSDGRVVVFTDGACRSAGRGWCILGGTPSLQRQRAPRRHRSNEQSGRTYGGYTYTAIGSPSR